MRWIPLAGLVVLAGVLWSTLPSTSPGDASGQSGESAIDMTANLVLTTRGNVYVRTVPVGNLTEDWTFVTRVNTQSPAVAIVEYRGGPFPWFDVLTSDGGVYQVVDDGTGPRQRYQGNSIGIAAPRSVRPKVIRGEGGLEGERPEGETDSP